LPSAFDSLRRKKVETADITLDQAARKLEGLEALWLEFGAEIAPPAAGRCGVRLISSDSKVAPLELSVGGDELTCGALVNPAVRETPEQPFQLRVHLFNGHVQVRSNSRLCFERPFPTEKPTRVELFTEGGAAQFSKIEAWQLAHDDIAAIGSVAGFYAHQTQDHRVRSLNKRIEAIKAGK
jgi:hypothetical protein